MTVTHRSDGQFWRIVVDVGDADEGGGRVGQAEVEVALHVGGLDDDGVLGHFLESQRRHEHVCKTRKPAHACAILMLAQRRALRCSSAAAAAESSTGPQNRRCKDRSRSV